MERATLTTTWNDNKPAGNNVVENTIVSPTCPRCGSMNTKFCYYNNYSLTQPRYFCKGCRRYWTKGGSLRNVPVGGGCRKTRRGKSIKGFDRGPFLGHRTNNIISTATTVENNFGGPTSPNTTGASGPNIDLAAVYANFLKQNPDPHHQPPRHHHQPPGAVGPPFEISCYPTMPSVDYFVPANGMALQEVEFGDEYGNHGGFFQEQFVINNNNNDDNQDGGNFLLPPIILPEAEGELIATEGIEWSNNNSDMNMMFPLQTSTTTTQSAVIEEPQQGQVCLNHNNHHNNIASSSSHLFSIPTNYDSIFRP